MPAAFPSDAQAIDVRLEAFVESAEIRERILRIADRRVTQPPQEGGFLGMLFDDGFDDRR